MLYEEARQEILDVCRRMVRKGYFLGTWGNVSVRIGDHIVLTPSKVEYGSMELEDSVVIDLEGNKVEATVPLHPKRSPPSDLSGEGRYKSGYPCPYTKSHGCIGIANLVSTLYGGGNVTIVRRQNPSIQAIYSGRAASESRKRGS